MESTDEETKDIFEILDEEPQDHAAGGRSTAKINLDDFAKDEKEDQDNSDNSEGSEGSRAAPDNKAEGEGDDETQSEDSTEAEEKEPLTERQQKIQDAKKEVVQSLIEPATVIAFADMGLSRLGSMAPNSERSDWQLDKEEKEVFTAIFDAMVEEEGINFWPAKIWLLLAVIFVYGAKGFLVWDGSAESQAEDPAVLKLQGEKDIARLEIIRDIEKQKAALQTEISEYQEITIDSPRNGSPKKIPDDGYIYEADGTTHVENTDGSWKKKPGTKPAGRSVVEEAEVIEDKDDGEE